jgi:hypothetical protein
VLFLCDSILALFSIIASSIDFNPGSRRVVEFMENHGDTAGIWMLLPTIVVSYASPEAILQGIFAAAIVVELHGFRHRRTENAGPISLIHVAMHLTNQAALIKLIGNLSHLATNHPEIVELDLNPVFASGNSLVAVDCLMMVD